MYKFARVQSLLFCILLMAVIITPSAWPQASTGTVSGTVRDQTGAVIPSASVTLSNKATGIASKTSTNGVGFYMFPGVVPGQYSITVEAPGMQKFEGSLTVQVQQSATVDVTMKVGQTTTEVQVQDVTPMLTVDSPVLGHTLERTRIEQLPLNGRALTSLLQTIPGMEGTRAFGLRDFSFEFSLDGSPLADRYGWNTLTMRQPGLDSIQEFKVETNNSSAKFPRPTNIVATTKSGTNELHGTAFETNRNNAVGLARSRTDYYTKAPYLNRNEFGASGGGPVYIPKVYNGKNRTFWFFTWEGLRQVQNTTKSFTDPSQAMRNGDMRELVDANGNPRNIYNPWTTDPVTWSRDQFSYNGQLNVIDPKLLNPVAKYLNSVMPLPNQPGVNLMVTDNWYGPVLSTRRDWSLSTRVDHRFTDKDSFYGRYTKGSYKTLGQFYSQPSLDWSKVPAGTQGYDSPNQSVSFNWVHTFSPTFFNELLASGTRSNMYVGTGQYGRKYADELNLPNPFDAWGWPGLYDTGLNGYYWETQNTNSFRAWYMNYDDNATKIVGRHELQFGFHYRWDQMNLLPQQQQVAGNHNWATGATALYDPSTSRTNPQATAFTGFNFANFMIGVANYSNQFVRGMFYGRGKETALYFQDNYKVTSRLTLNLGLRWDYWPAYTEKHNVATSFDPTTKAVVLSNTLSNLYTFGMTLPSIVDRFTSLGGKLETWDQAGLPNNLWDTPKKNFGPRLGFAYRVGEGAKGFVVRGGYRISYFHIPLGPWAARMRMNAPMNARFYTSVTQAAYSPDGISNYGMRSVPTLLFGVNTKNAVSLETAKSLSPGSFSVDYFNKNMPDARVQDWNLTVEKEVMSNTVVRVGYVGNHSDHMEQLYQYNESTPEYIWYVTTGQPLPTGTYSGVARRFFDQQVYGTLERWQNTGWGNSNGISLELERRYSKGFGYQVFYVMDNDLMAGGNGYSGNSIIPEVNQYLPGQVPADLDQRNRLLNYRRDTNIPKHRVRFNWVVDLPFGKGKPLGGNVGGLLDRLIGGWQVTGMGNVYSRYIALPTNYFPTTGVPVTVYGEKYKIQDCTSGVCYPGYLYWNGYIPAHQINSYDPVTGKPNGYMGIPPEYKPAVQPLWPYPANYRSLNSSTDPLYAWYGSNTLWVPLKNGTVQRTSWTGLAPLQNQFLMVNRNWSVDASLIKNVKINERFNFRLSGDFFNVFNHPGNGTPGSNGIMSTRGSANSPRTIQISGRISF